MSVITRRHSKKLKSPESMSKFGLLDFAQCHLITFLCCLLSCPKLAFNRIWISSTSVNMTPKQVALLKGNSLTCAIMIKILLLGILLALGLSWGKTKQSCIWSNEVSCYKTLTILFQVWYRVKFPFKWHFLRNYLRHKKPCIIIIIIFLSK